MHYACPINWPKVPILLVPHMPCLDRILLLRQHQHLIERKPQPLVRRNQRPLLGPSTDISTLLQRPYACLALGHRYNGRPPERVGKQNRALRNLIDNAVRYGGVAEVSLMQEPGITVIMVSDKGPGLPKDQLEAVFEPFVRLEGSRNRDTGGVGLGLAIARTIIQAHGGTIQQGNRTCGGLSAVVRLPIGQV